jgi:hypothetical protein
MFGKKPREYATIAEDPALPYQIGRIIGAAEVAAQLLMKQENPDVKVIGDNLYRAVSWFFEPGDQKELPEGVGGWHN